MSVTAPPPFVCAAHDNPVRPGTPWTPDQCRACWLPFKDLAPGAPPRLGVKQVPGDCPHRGAPTGETVGCPSCGGKRVELKVFACAVHAEGCTLARKVDGKACCRGCPDRPTVPASAGRVKSERGKLPGAASL